MTPLRSRLWFPPNAVPDTGITMRNGRPVRANDNCIVRLVVPPAAPPAPPPKKRWAAPVNKSPYIGGSKPRHDEFVARFGLREIRLAVCAAWQCGELEMVSQRRNQPIVTARQVAMALCRRLTAHGFPAIGRAFGGRDHTTVIHARNKMAPHIQAVAAELGEDATLASWVQAMKDRMPSYTAPRGRG